MTAIPLSPLAAGVAFGRVTSPRLTPGERGSPQLTKRQSAPPPSATKVSTPPSVPRSAAPASCPQVERPASPRTPAEEQRSDEKKPSSFSPSSPSREKPSYRKANSMPLPARGQSPCDAWCFEVLGLQYGEADPAEIKRAFRQRARETHPDKGGSAEEFNRLTLAVEALTGAGATDDPCTTSPGSPPSDKTESYRKFSLNEVNQLAAEVRRMARDRERDAREALNAKTAQNDGRRLRSQQSAEKVRSEEAQSRIRQALRLQRRATLPAGIEFRSVKVGTNVSDRFCATVEIAGATQNGPARKSLDMAEADLARLRRASERFPDDGVMKVLEIIKKDVPRGGWK